MLNLRHFPCATDNGLLGWQTVAADRGDCHSEGFAPEGDALLPLALRHFQEAVENGVQCVVSDWSEVKIIACNRLNQPDWDDHWRVQQLTVNNATQMVGCWPLLSAFSDRVVYAILEYARKKPLGFIRDVRDLEFGFVAECLELTDVGGIVVNFLNIIFGLFAASAAAALGNSLLMAEWRR